MEKDMKVEQKEIFQPITITLETEEEAKVLYNLIEKSYDKYNSGSEDRRILVDLSNKLGSRIIC